MSRKIYDYKVFLEKDPDGGYVVVCPSFQGCYSEGDTVEEALENIKEAIELCIEDLVKSGEPIPEPSHTFIGNVVIVHDT
ncbi:MAG: type II toxin-antitoxin system HicB family antitoxin [Candidatus Sigynarchaeota archaeon]